MKLKLILAVFAAVMLVFGYLFVWPALVMTLSAMLGGIPPWFKFAAGGFFLFLLWYIFGRKQKSYKKQMRALKKMQKKVSGAHGSAGFAQAADLKAMEITGKDGVLLGKFDEHFLRFNKPGHLITFAPTRSGKGVGHVIPNLLSHPGSVVVNDIKGENLAITKRYREQFTKVIAFAPFDDESSCYNPLDFIRVGTENELDDTALIADMIILEDNSNDPFWTREAKNLVTGLILFVVNENPPPLRTLGEVRYLLTQSQEEFEFTVKKMTQSKSELVQRIANSLSTTEPKVMASIMSTAKSQTSVWDSPRLVKITSKSDFQMVDLKEDPVSLYIVIPPEYLNVYKPIVRLMIAQAVTATTRVQKKPKHPIVFLIDEFPALGYMQPIEAGIGYLAGYGVMLWMFIQDLSQLKDLYERWATFISNCSVRMAFGTNDVETAKTLSEMLGTTTVTVDSEGTSAAKGDGGKSKSSNKSEISRSLMTADEVMRLPNDSQLIFVQGGKPIVAEKIRYFADKAFKGKFDAW